LPCTRCRKATGAAHAANGFVKPETFRWTQGASEVQRYDLPEATASDCNSASMRIARTPCHARRRAHGDPAGSLDEDPGSRPQAIVFWGSRAPWYRDCSKWKNTNHAR